MAAEASDNTKTGRPTGPRPGSGPKLRLVGAEVADAPPQPIRRTKPKLTIEVPWPDAPASAAATANGEPKTPHLIGNADPRWVLAVRTAECLQGTVLPPERRASLIRMGRVFGLSTFDANLIIAIVQDQARRGYRPELCPTMGEAQLRMIPLPRRGIRDRLKLTWLPQRRALTTSMIIAGIMLAELLLLWLWLG